MERKGARLATVLQDVNQFVEALQMGVSSSFDDNGLTPVPAKVQEAVESSAELRAIAARAQGMSLVPRAASMHWNRKRELLCVFISKRIWKPRSRHGQFHGTQKINGNSFAALVTTAPCFLRKMPLILFGGDA